MILLQAPPPLSTPAPATPDATNGIGPKIQFETMVHDFGRAKCGDLVKYTYIFTNVGDRVLELSGVRACGCITSDFTRKVEPGQFAILGEAVDAEIDISSGNIGETAFLAQFLVEP